MGRRSKSDNAAMGVIYLIGLPFFLLWGLVSAIIWLIGKIILLFSPADTPQSKKQDKQELNAEVGITTLNCPYCGVALKKFPGRKTKCKSCGNYMYVRTRPADDERILIKEDEIELIEDEKAKKYGYSRDSLIIDVSDEMDGVLKFLKRNYKDFCTYDAIQKIDETDRKSLMLYVWERWDVRIDEKDLYSKYPHYNTELLDEIAKIESGRRQLYFRKNEFYKNFGKEYTNKHLIKVSMDRMPRGDYYCRLYEMELVFNFFVERLKENEFINPPDYIIAPTYLPEDEKPLYLYADEDFRPIKKDILLDICKKMRLEHK